VKHYRFSGWIGAVTSWPIRKLACTARRYRTIEIQTGAPRSPPPTRCPPTCDALDHIHGLSDAH